MIFLGEQWPTTIARKYCIALEQWPTTIARKYRALSGLGDSEKLNFR